MDKMSHPFEIEVHKYAQEVLLNFVKNFSGRFSLGAHHTKKSRLGGNEQFQSLKQRG